MTVSLTLYILQAKFSDSALNSLKAQLLERTDIALSNDPATASIIVTSLVQRRRLERELRSLNLTATVQVYQYLNLPDAFEVPMSQTNREAAWCVYQPLSVLPKELPRNPDENGIIVETMDAATIAPAISLGKPIEVPEPIPPPELLIRPSMMRHESTADPTSVHYSRHSQGASNEKFSCQRETPLNCINSGLVFQLDRLRQARTLQLDSIGERAYSTAIASLKAYPNPIESAEQVVGLEGLGPKFIAVIKEYLNTGRIVEVDATWADGDLQTLFEFWQTHAVGAHTAREWFYEKGYRHLNDAIQAWDSYSRNIQIGLKFYDDFLRKMDRMEVEHITDIIAKAYQDIVNETHTVGTASEISFVVCGGYRRGKVESSDVDLICTHDSVHSHETLLKLLDRLHDQGFAEEVIKATNEVVSKECPEFGISTALVVFKNTNTGPLIRRRVDILMTRPASYTTCILGWSGSRTFVRDLRLYTSKVKSWKFDSSAITSEVDGKIVDVKGTWWTPGADPVVLEQRLFDILELKWIPPELRNAD